jgi:hypothetical protein
MKVITNYLILLFLLCFTFDAAAQFDKYFTSKTLRIDYFHSGDKDSEYWSFDETLIEPYWAGSKTNLIDTFEYGKYFFKVVDLPDEKVIYSRGYSTLFSEWQTTEEAKQTRKTFTETVVMPLPKKDVRVDFYSRNKQGELVKVFEYVVDIKSYFIKPERRLGFPAFDVEINGDPEKKVDIVILPEGYTGQELGQFISDCKQFANHLFEFEPYKTNQEKFNIRAVLAPSQESGSDIPADNTWKKTLMNTTFYTFDSERYCMTTDSKSVRDLAANAPYDQIYILVNHPKYGGGAIYNDYSVSVNSNEMVAKIFVHEFGHGFAGLGDEYYTDDVAYSEFYQMNVEPWEPNITTLTNFDAKWKNLVDKKTLVPTPNEERYKGITGVFEGGGYSAKGIYRPSYDCLMNTFKGNVFCEVCQKSIQEMIDFYCE